MTPITGAAYLPHPPILIPEIGNGEEKSASKTQEGFSEVIDEIKRCHPDALILLTPHGSASHHLLAVNESDVYKGSFAAFGFPRLALEVNSEKELRKQIVEFGIKSKLSITGNKITLDHGALVPLYFLNKAGINLPMVHISVGWSDLQEAYDTGVKLGSLCEAYGKNIVVIASGDLSHRLKENGPYGFHPKGPLFDEKIKEAFETNQLETLLDIEKDVIEGAGQCGLIPFLIATGMLNGQHVNATCHSYQNPYGVGYLCGFAAVDEDKEHHPAVILAKAAMKKFIEESVVLDVESFVKRFPKDPFITRGLKEKAGAFVSIHSRGSLRGCIGTIESVHENLLKEIVANAIEAATRDPRFHPIHEGELDELEIKVDEMAPLEQVESMEELDVQKYGVVVESGYRRGLLLPALDGVDTVKQQISIACQKAGINLSEKYQTYRFKVTRYH